MDFITLANAAHETSRTFIRLLTEDNGAGSEDDDFANLENMGGRSHSSPAADVGGSAAHYDYSSTTQDAATPSSMENRPLLSPTAEAALLELSSNFLLYIAMVLITILVAKVYFPTWLEPREEPTTRLSHAYMNVMEEAYKSDFSDEEDDDDDLLEMRAGSLVGGNKEGGDSKISSDDNDEEVAGLLDEAEGGAPSRTTSSFISQRSRASSSFIFDYDQETQSKESVYTNLAICAVMLNLTFVSWGLLQVCGVISVNLQTST